MGATVTTATPLDNLGWVTAHAAPATVTGSPYSPTVAVTSNSIALPVEGYNGVIIRLLYTATVSTTGICFVYGRRGTVWQQLYDTSATPSVTINLNSSSGTNQLDGTTFYSNPSKTIPVLGCEAVAVVMQTACVTTSGSTALTVQLSRY